MRVGLVVGATGGIGAACARRLASCDVDRLVLTGRRTEALKKIATCVGARAVSCPCDLTVDAERGQLLARLRQLGGTLSWVVIASGTPVPRPLAEADDDQIRAALAANLQAPILLTKSLLGMQWDYRRRLIFIGSISADRALPNRSVYGASKAGIEHFARSLATEVADRGISVNVVSPGVIATPFIGETSQALAEWVEQRVPLGRMGTAAEVAEIVRYLVAEAPPYVTGSRFVVDGGVEAWA